MCYTRSRPLTGYGGRHGRMHNFGLVLFRQLLLIRHVSLACAKLFLLLLLILDDSSICVF